MRVLGMDPSLASFGMALVETDPPAYLIGATIVTVAALERHRRLRIIFDEIRTRLGRWQERWTIDLVAFEAGFSFAGGGRHADLAIAEARGVGLLAASHLECVTVAPTTVRKAVCGSGRAKKPEVAPALAAILGTRKSLQPDIADAAAVALTAGGFSVPHRAARGETLGPLPRSRTKPGRQTEARRLPPTISESA